jgi:amidase
LKRQISAEKKEQLKAFVRKASRDNAIHKVLDEHNADVLISLVQGRVGSMAAAAGCPVGAVPLGYAETFNGRPYGLMVIGRADEEDKVVSFMSAWDATHPGLRKPPPALVASRLGKPSM